MLYELVSGVQPQPMSVLFNAGFADRIGLENFCANIDASLARARGLVDLTCTGPEPG